VEGGTRPIGGSRGGGESTSEARREGLGPLQTRPVPSGRREATEAGNRRPNFCRTVLAGQPFAESTFHSLKISFNHLGEPDMVSQISSCTQKSKGHHCGAERIAKLVRYATLLASLPTNASFDQSRNGCIYV